MNLIPQEIDIRNEPEIDGAIINENSIDVALVDRIGEIVGEKDEVKIKGILDWIKSRGAESPEQIMWEFRHLSNTLSTPRLGESRLNKIYRYITLDKTSREVRKEMESLQANI